MATLFNATRDPGLTGGVGSPEMTDAERRLADLFRIGKVTAVDYSDTTAPRVRVGVGDPADADGYTVTDWLPIAFARDDEWNPLKVGAAVTVISESGELPNGVVLPGSINNTARPAVGDRANLWRKRFDDGTVVEYDEATKAYKIDGVSGASVTLGVGANTIAISGSGITISAGGRTWTLNSTGFAQTGGTITHDGKIIGKTHTHISAASGSPTSAPV